MKTKRILVSFLLTMVMLVNSGFIPTQNSQLQVVGTDSNFFESDGDFEACEGLNFELSHELSKTDYILTMDDNKNHGGQYYPTLGGQAVEITNSAVYIDGVSIGMGWTYDFYSPEYPYYHRQQNLIPLADFYIDTTSTKIGTFSGSQGVSSSNAIRLLVTNVRYNYYYFASGNGYTTYNDEYFYPECIYIFIDVDTGKVIDTHINYYYVFSGHTCTWTTYYQ